MIDSDLDINGRVAFTTVSPKLRGICDIKILNFIIEKMTIVG